MTNQLANIKPGLALVLFGLAFGITLSIGFGVNEDAFKGFIADGIAAHRDIHDEKSQGKIWRYAQRAHFHSTGIAAFSIGLLLLVSFSDMKKSFKKFTSVLIGLGTFYPFAWFSMFLLAPAIGRNDAHSHIITEVFTCVGIVGLIMGFLLLIGNLFFSFFAESSDV